jgi:intein/homing endonuclease
MEIEFDDGYVVTCSLEHKFMVNGNWIEAKDLQEEDLVLSID